MIDLRNEYEKSANQLARYKLWYRIGYVTTKLVFFVIFVIGVIAIFRYFW